MKKKNLIRDLSLDFAVKIVQLSQILREKRQYVLADQLLRSGTSIGANVQEASAGQSRKDFVAKLSIASKEARETSYWLTILERGKIIEVDLAEYHSSIQSINNILSKIILTTLNKEGSPQNELRK